MNTIGMVIKQDKMTTLEKKKVRTKGMVIKGNKLATFEKRETRY